MGNGKGEKLESLSRKEAVGVNEKAANILPASKPTAFTSGRSTRAGRKRPADNKTELVAVKV